MAVMVLIMVLSPDTALKAIKKAHKGANGSLVTRRHRYTDTLVDTSGIAVTVQPFASGDGRHAK